MPKGLIKKITAVLSLLCMMMGLIVALVNDASAHNWNIEWFLKHYNDSHFDLSIEPERNMTVEEFIAVIYAYSYYGDGAEGVSAIDKNGNSPSEWCAKYVGAEVQKNTVVPSETVWNDEVDLAFAAQFLTRAKGKYSYEFNNRYYYTGTEGLSAEDIMYIHLAIDCGLIEYTPFMDVSQPVKRKDALKYEIPSGQVSVKAETPVCCNDKVETMHVYFPNNYWDFEKASEVMKEMEDILPKTSQDGPQQLLVTFDCGYVTGERADPDKQYLYQEVEHEGALKMYRSRGWDIDEDIQLTAVKKLQASGGKALFGINNLASNGFSIDAIKIPLQSTAGMNALIDEIMNTVEKYNFDGVNMGFEVTAAVDSELRNNYSRFIELLADRLHNKDKILLVTVGSYFKASEESCSLYDYDRIGKAADYVHVILYDDFPDTSFVYTGKHGPMSNIIRIKRVMNYASERIQPSKLLLGMGLIGIDYNLNGYTAKDLTFSEICDAVNKSGGAVKTGEASSAYVEYSENGYNHIVWFETVDTINERIAVANNLGCGISFYCLNGGVSHDIWKELKDRYACRNLQNISNSYRERDTGFEDISSQSWYAQNVYNAVNYGVMNGKSGSVFDPNGSIRICEAIKMAAVVHNLYRGLDGTFDTSYGSNWYDAYVSYAVFNGIISEDDFTDYNAEASRADMAYIFSNAIDKTDLETINVTRSPKDVTQNTKYSENIRLLYNAGVLTGDAGSYNYRPDDSITRAEAATIILRIIDRDYRIK